MNAESLCIPGDQPEKEREGEGERKKEREKKRKTWGDQASSVSKAHYFISKRDFYTLTCTQREMKDAKPFRVSPSVTSVLSLSKPGFFLQTFPINNVCTLSSGLGGL